MSEKEPIKKTFTPQEASVKAQKYCSYQERCQQEVRDKLYEWGLWRDDVESIITDLIGNDVLNEERFAKSYARGKFRIKKWGKVKIRHALQHWNISDYCMKIAMQEIDGDEYMEVLRKIISGKLKGGSKKSPALNHKAGQYAISRGYEAELVWKIVNEK